MQSIDTTLLPPRFPPLPVRFLVSRTRTGTAELLGFTSSVVCNKEGTIVCHECLLELVFAVLVDVLLVVCDLPAKLVRFVDLDNWYCTHYTLCDCLSDRVDL